MSDKPDSGSPASDKAAPADIAIQLAAALEQQRAYRIVEDVSATRSSRDMREAFDAGFVTACEEIMERLKTEEWSLLGKPQPIVQPWSLDALIRARDALEPEARGPILYALTYPGGNIMFDDEGNPLVSCAAKDLEAELFDVDGAAEIVGLYTRPAHPPAALPEPVAYIYRTVNGLQALCYADDKRDGVEGSFIPLYLHPPARPALPGGGLAAAERLIRLRQNVGNAEYERQCDDWLAHLRLAEGK